MKKLNNKGFTLIEVLAVIAIIAVLGLIAVPNVLSSISTSKESSYKVIVDNIKTASVTLFEEVENNGSIDGAIKSNNTISTTLQVLVDNGFLSGTNKDNGHGKKIVNPKDNKDMGNCSITITKVVSDNYKVTYEVTSNSSDAFCPTTDEYSNN